MTGLSAYCVGVFITDDLPIGRYTIEQVDEHQFTIGLPETASPWDVLRLANSLSVGPLSAERIDGAVLVTDARWSSADVEDHPDVVADGGTLQTSVIDESPPGSVADPFAVTDDDEPRTERAKTEDMEFHCYKKVVSSRSTQHRTATTKSTWLQKNAAVRTPLIDANTSGEFS